MKKINKTFIAGMLAMALVFGMTGCPQGTNTVTKTVTVPGTNYPNSPVPSPVTGKPYLAYSVGDIRTHIAQYRNLIYVIGNVDIDDGASNGDLVIPEGVFLVLASLDYATKHPDGLMNISGIPDPSLYHSKLTLKEGASLTVADNAGIIVGNPGDTSKRSLLVVEPNARLYISGGAYPVVTTESKIIVQKPDGVPSAPNTGLFHPDGQLYILGSLGTKVVYGTEDDLDSALIVIEDKAPAAIGPSVEVQSAATIAALSQNQGSAVPPNAVEKLSDITDASPSKIATTNAVVKARLETSGVTTVTYTGTEPITGVTVTEGKELIITGTIDGQAVGITVTGTGKVTNKGTIKTEVTAVATLNDILKIGGNITANADVTVTSGSALNVPENTTLTIDGKKLTLAGTITGGGAVKLSGPGTFEVSSTAALNSAVAFNVPEISLNNTFYTTEVTSLIVIGKDAGARNTETNRVTITGLGTATTAPALSVGVQIANDYITLQDVKIVIDSLDYTKGKKTFWVGSAPNKSYYASAVFLGRGIDTESLHEKGKDDPVHNVKLLNSSITVTASTADYAAGVWVDGSYSAGPASSPTYDYSPSKYITISGNTINVTGNASGSATQGIAISPYHSSITITNNVVTAQHPNTTLPGKPFDVPTSAIYIRTVNRDADSGGAIPNISGNTIHNNVNAASPKSVYSFYFNAYDTWLANHTAGTSTAGLTALRNDRFGNYETTWALPGANDKTSVYKKLFNALLSNITGSGTEAGFAAVGSELTFEDYAFEQYKISENKVINISVHGFHIDSTSGNYTGPATGTGSGNKFAKNALTGGNSTSVSTKDYGSFSFNYDASGNVATDATNGVTTKNDVDKFFLSYNTKAVSWKYNTNDTE
jgi:hypothetical protein